LELASHLLQRLPYPETLLLLLDVVLHTQNFSGTPPWGVAGCNTLLLSMLTSMTTGQMAQPGRATSAAAAEPTAAPLTAAATDALMQPVLQLLTPAVLQQGSSSSRAEAAPAADSIDGQFSNHDWMTSWFRRAVGALSGGTW
jgi:hypothetical protein